MNDSKMGPVRWISLPTLPHDVVSTKAKDYTDYVVVYKVILII